MGYYTRKTRECLVSQLQPELRQAIQNYGQIHHLGDLDTETLLCCETVSKKKSTSRLLSWLSSAADTTVYTGMLLTPQWLLWVRSGDQSGVGLSAARLIDIQVKAYTSLLTSDTGLEVNGYVGETPHRVRGYIGLEANPASEKFCAAVREAIAKVKPPSKKSLFSF